MCSSDYYIVVVLSPIRFSSGRNLIEEKARYDYRPSATGGSVRKSKEKETPDEIWQGSSSEG